MILGIGTDIVDSRRIGALIERFSEKFTSRIFTDSECNLAKCRVDQASFFAKRFAAKEAVYKALSSSGVKGLKWRQAETYSCENGAPMLRLTGQCETALKVMIPDGHEAQILLTLSDELPYALAFVIINAVPKKLKV